MCVLQFYERELCRVAVAMAVFFHTLITLDCILCPFRKGKNFMSKFFWEIEIPS
jgi:hypothetical protein